MEYKTKQKLVKPLAIIGVILVILLFCPVHLFLLHWLAEDVISRYKFLSYIHYIAFGVAVVANITLAYVAPPSDEDAGNKPNFFKFLRKAGPLAVAFAVGFGVASFIYKKNSPPVSRSAETVTVTLIGNRNTKKLHLSTCSSVDDMAEKNKVSFPAYINAEKNGYEPCKICRPDLNWKGK